MQYLFKEKLIRPGLNIQDVYEKLVLVAEPNKTLAEIYTRHFEKAGFLAHACSKLEGVKNDIKEFDPKLLLLSIDLEKGKFLPLIKEIFYISPRIRIITASMGNVETDMNKIISAGVSGHINKSITRPVDVAMLALHVLQLT